MTANNGEHEREDAQTDDRRGDVPADTFAIRLVLVRHHAGRLSIEKAAELSGLNSGNWANWEGGRQPRDRADVAGVIADTFGIDFNWLFWGGPLESPRGRPVKPRMTKRPTSDTLRYPSSSVRPSSVRPTSNRPGGRGDSARPGSARPVVVDSALSEIGNRLTNVG